jgi:hypothetical protein
METNGCFRTSWTANAVQPTAEFALPEGARANLARARTFVAVFEKQSRSPSIETRRSPGVGPA